MDVWYWRFPHLEGRWSVSQYGKHVLTREGAAPPVFLELAGWRGNDPVTHAGHVGTRCREEPLEDRQDAWASQVGGRHYADMVIQPFEFSMANKLDPMQHTIIKYVARFRDKNGIQDLEKAKHTIDLLIAWENKHNEKRNAD